MKVKSLAFKISIFALSLFFLLAIFIFLPALRVPDMSYLQKKNPRLTAMMEYRQQEARAKGKKYKIVQKWLPYEKIPRLFRKAVIFSEDAEFFYHNGIDWYEVKEAFLAYALEGKTLRGASTISQQVVKNLYLSPKRSFYRKLEEFRMVKRLERDLSKKRILEIYLNTAEWGPGVFGCAAAANYWFHKNLSQLNNDQLIALAVMLPAPLKWSPVKPNKRMREKIKKIKKILTYNGYIGKKKIKTIVRPTDKELIEPRIVPDKIKKARITIDSLGKDEFIP